MILKAVAVLFFIIAVSGGRLSYGYNSIGEMGLAARQWDVSNSGSRFGSWGGSGTPRSDAGSSAINFRSRSLSGDRCNPARSSAGRIPGNNGFYGDNNAW